MRTLLVIPVAAAVAVIAGAGTGSGAVEARIPRTPPVVAGYNVKATFSGTLTVHWGFKYGEPGPGCGVWAEGGGLSKFHADSIRPARGYLQIFSPLRGPLSPNWASLSLLGKAKGRAERSITINAGGVNWDATCRGTRPRRPSSIDCGERSFRTIRAVLHAADGNFVRTLDPIEIIGPDDPIGLNREDLIYLTIHPGREPFSSCGIPSWAEKPHYGRTFLEGAALRVNDGDWGALRNLRRGQSYPVTDFYGGACTDGVPARDCAFVLKLKLTITRV